MEEAIAVALQVTKILEDLGVTYLVGGSLASFYVDEPAVLDAVRRRATFNVIHLATLFKADIFVAGSKRSTQRELDRRRSFELDTEARDSIIVASPEDIIVQKLHWYRLGDHVSDRQWSDAMGVLKIRGRKLDLVYMRDLAADMGVEDLLVQALKEAGLEA